MSLGSSPALRLGLALAAAVGAGLLLWQSLRSSSDDSEKSYYYDLSEKRLFVADRTAIPPIRGVNDATVDGVRAVVVSTNGLPQNKATWRIAYLETCTPELKADLESARAAGTSPKLGRSEAQQHRLVKRPGDANWVPLATPEGEALVSEWAAWGSGDQSPVVCNPP
jgi:hypothetical protein